MVATLTSCGSVGIQPEFDVVCFNKRWIFSYSFVVIRIVYPKLGILGWKLHVTVR